MAIKFWNVCDELERDDRVQKLMIFWSNRVWKPLRNIVPKNDGQIHSRVKKENQLQYLAFTMDQKSLTR